MKVDSMRRAASVTLVMVTILVLLAGLTGCENEQKQPRGAVGGRVFDTAGNQLEGAVVTSHRSRFTAVTGKKGDYMFTSLDEGSHRLAVTLAGYKTASKTLSITGGEVVEGIDFRLEAQTLDKITWSVFSRETATVTIDVVTAEPMTCQAVYQGEHLPQIRTQPSSLAVEHRFVLTHLFPQTLYTVHVEGTTSDGRTFRSASGTVQAVPQGDVPGAPPAPVGVRVEQTAEGPKLSWDYQGIDPLRGFRLYRAEEDGTLSEWQKEDFVTAGIRSVVDDLAPGGVRMRYAVAAVDRDNNISSLSTELTFLNAGVLSRDVVWKQSWGTLDLYGDIQVPPGRQLTIQSGVTVRVSANDLMRGGIEGDRIEMLIDGRLVILASGSTPVRFFSGSALQTPSDWAGFRIRTARTAAEPNILQNLEVANARIGVLIVDTTVEAAGLTAKYCETGVKMQAASGTLVTDIACSDCTTGFMAEGTLGCSAKRVSILGGTTGISLQGNRSFTLRDFSVRESLDLGVLVADVATPTLRAGLIEARRLGLQNKVAGGTLQHLTINAVNGVLVDGSARPELIDCILVNLVNPGTGYGLEEKTVGRSYPYNNIYGFSTPVRNCDQNGAPILNIDPQFVGGTPYDYHLRTGSPLLGTSSTGGQMGAYGDPGEEE